MARVRDAAAMTVWQCVVLQLQCNTRIETRLIIFIFDMFRPPKHCDKLPPTKTTVLIKVTKVTTTAAVSLYLLNVLLSVLIKGHQVSK